MIIDVTERDIKIIITALLLYVHIPLVTLDSDHRRAKELCETMKKLIPLEEKECG